MPNCIAELARSVANPWAYSACIPDGSTGLGKYTLKQVDSLVTGATGTALGVALSCSDVVNYIKLNTGGLVATQTFTGNWSSAVSTTSTTFYKRNRLVSAGLRVTFAGNTATDSGMLLFGNVPASISPVAFDGVTMSVAMSFMNYCKVIPARNGGTITWRPADADDQGDLYENLAASALTNAAVVYRPYLICLAYGMSTNGAGSLYVETVTNWEGQFQNATFSPGGQTTMAAPTPAASWYERGHALYNKIAPIAAVFGNAAVGYLSQSNATSSNLLTMGSGITVEDL